MRSKIEKKSHKKFWQCDIMQGSMLVEKADWPGLWQHKHPCQKWDVSWHSDQMFSWSDMSGNLKKKQKTRVQFGRRSAVMQRKCGCKDQDVINGVMLTCVVLTLWFTLWVICTFFYARISEQVPTLCRQKWRENFGKWCFCMTVHACTGHNKFIVSVDGVRDGLYTL